MHGDVSQIGRMLALSVACGLVYAAAIAQPVAEYGDQGGIMVKQQAAVWLQCQSEAGQIEAGQIEPGQIEAGQIEAGAIPDLPGFCARLRSDLARQSGRVLGTEAIVPEGAQVLRVTIAPHGAYRAMVTLAVGRQVGGQFLATTTQQMRLRSMDAPLQAGSAAALVYPLVSLLETLR